MMRRPDKMPNIRNMYTHFQHNFHQPLQPKHLLIADVMQNQQIPVNWKGVPSDIETLISYNVQDNGITRDAFQIEYGQHMTAKCFMAAQNSIESCRSVVVTWPLIPLHSYAMPDYRLSYPQ